MIRVPGIVIDCLGVESGPIRFIGRVLQGFVIEEGVDRSGRLTLAEIGSLRRCNADGEEEGERFGGQVEDHDSLLLLVWRLMLWL